MQNLILNDKDDIADLLQRTRDEAVQFLEGLSTHPVNHRRQLPAPVGLSPSGLGARQALEVFKETYIPAMTGSAGPRYLGFVTGGSTPAALMGDWLTGVFDQNAADTSSAAAAQIETSAISMLRELFGLPEAFDGRFVTGATMSNFVGLAIGRQWWGHRLGVNVAQQGLAGLPPLTVLSGSPHACIYKSISMLGLGRQNLQQVTTLPNREAVDVDALRQAIQRLNEQPCIVVANAGVVNTVDFDEITAIVALKRDFNFYLHVDAAFGGFAACSPRYQQLVSGWEQADSIAVDAHKWLNVPYDSAVQFSRHTELQAEVFQNVGAAYLGEPNTTDSFHLTPENSRRLRALPAWFSLVAYGKEGFREIVETCCDCAAQLGKRIEASTEFRLLAPVRMNVVPFTFHQPSASSAQVAAFLNRLGENGKTFITATTYNKTPGFRAAFSNWRTTREDVDIIWQAALDAVSEQIRPR